jgi:hypothetical protein
VSLKKIQTFHRNERTPRKRTFNCGAQSAISDISHCAKRPAISGQSTDARRGILDRAEHLQAAQRAAADIEGHSKAVKYGQPRRLSARADGRQTLNPSKLSVDSAKSSERDVPKSRGRTAASMPSAGK